MGVELSLGYNASIARLNMLLKSQKNRSLGD